MGTVSDRMMTRRHFLELVGYLGGASVALGGLKALGLKAAEPTTQRGAGKFELRGNGRGRTVLILGAGISGMCAAYELGKVGYDCRILEARTRTGGRCHTIRRDTVETETDGRTQSCTFDDGQYFNPGPARIAQHHVTLDYCRELGVAIEQFGNQNEAAFLYRQRPGALSGRRVRFREARSDLYGYVAELLAKAVNQKALDQVLSPEDKRALLQYLAHEGGLAMNMTYRGSDRRGFRTWPGAAEAHGEQDDPFTLHEILQSELGKEFAFNWTIHQQATMFQIVGGMDRLAQAFERRLGPDIELGARVTEIRQTPTSVEVLYTDRLGRPQQASAEFCICTIPLPVLKHIPANFSEKMTRAIAAGELVPATKVGLQFKRRFWEEDDGIFAGISRTDQSITQIMYPSNGFLGSKGVLVGCYNFGAGAEELGRLTPQQRMERTLAEGSKIHPQYASEFESGFSVAWEKTPYSLGAFTAHSPHEAGNHYQTLCEPDGRVYLAGEHVSQLSGWIAGALESARHTARLIHDRAHRETVPTTPTSGATR